MNFLLSGDKKTTFLLIAIILILIAALVFSFAYYKKDSVKSSVLSAWSSDYVLIYNNHRYTVTDQFTKDIGKTIGTVTYHGNNPGSFKLYSIEQADDYSKIAIETRLGYLVAVIDK
jgi:hypothetical protein